MKTLHDQIHNRCIHFNGIMNKECKAGIKYEDVRVDKPYNFPCLKTGGICSKSQFPTEEEVQAEIKEIEVGGLWALTAMAKIIKEVKNSEYGFGTIDCDCGGIIHYSTAELNGHIRARCNKCNNSFME